MCRVAGVWVENAHTQGITSATDVPPCRSLPLLFRARTHRHNPRQRCTHTQHPQKRIKTTRTPVSVTFPSSSERATRGRKGMSKLMTQAMPSTSMPRESRSVATSTCCGLMGDGQCWGALKCGVGKASGERVCGYSVLGCDVWDTRGVEKGPQGRRQIDRRMRTTPRANNTRRRQMNEQEGTRTLRRPWMNSAKYVSRSSGVSPPWNSDACCCVYDGWWW